jgi:lipopolysaccharide export system protein LptC
MNHVGRWWMPIVLSLLAAFSWWLREAVDTSSTVTPARHPHLADYVTYGLTLIAMNPAGKPDYRLQAASMRHYLDDGSSELDLPRLTSFRQGNPPWRVSAEKGWSSANGDELRLLGRVTLDRSAGPQSEEIRIITSDVTLRPKEDYAETQKQVTATMGQHELESLGMRLFLAEDRLQLLSNVRGVYAPAD